MHAYPVYARFIVCSTLIFICTQHVSPLHRHPRELFSFRLVVQALLHLQKVGTGS